MLKQIFTVILTLFSAWALGQPGNPDFENLVKLGGIYSRNVNATGDDFRKSVEGLRTPGLDHIIDALIAVGGADTKLLTKEFLTKPSETELKYWYVLREIHYNLQSKNPDPRPNDIVAREVLDGEIDSRWLLDNYYYRIRGGIAKVFNDKDLSNLDINLADYGLQNETERAVLFFSISTALVQRFQVLQMVKKPDKLLEFASKLPTFNGEAYHKYTAFGFEDFMWMGHDKKESYKERHLGVFYASLSSHLSALASKDRTDEMMQLYYNSVLYLPDLFKYSGGMEAELQKLYDQRKKK